MLRKRSITLAGHRTSVALENAFWAELEAMAVSKGCSLQALVSQVDGARPDSLGLASALRLAVLASLKTQLREDNGDRTNADPKPSGTAQKSAGESAGPVADPAAANQTEPAP